VVVMVHFTPYFSAVERYETDSCFAFDMMDVSCVLGTTLRLFRSPQLSVPWARKRPVLEGHAYCSI
jgi:hypothetical protein